MAASRDIAVLDLFAGPGGWDVAARSLDIDPLGIELDEEACETRATAGLRTRKADISALDPAQFAPCDLLIASPPCPTFSRAGKRDGIVDMPLVWKAAKAVAAGEPWEFDWRDARSELVVEPLRWALALEPTYLAWEQVPDVIDFWEFCAERLRPAGWSVWTGVVEAERYGVPQTRERAILVASREGVVGPPPPTHQRYVKGVPACDEVTLEGEVRAWVSMADALDWHPEDLIGFPRRADGDEEGEYRERDLRPASEPSFALTEKTRSWTRQVAHPWVFERPATTVQGDPRIFPAGRAERDPDYKAGGDPVSQAGAGGTAVRVTIDEAAALQTFPRDYPFVGSQSKQFVQVGNAVPPLLARAILGSLLGLDYASP